MFTIPACRSVVLLTMVFLSVGPPGVERAGAQSMDVVPVFSDFQQDEGKINEAWKAAFSSLLLPGSGQLRQGRRSGWAFIAAEVVLIGGGIWAGYRGRSLQEDYEFLADLHWDRNSYLDYLSFYTAETGLPWPYDHHTLPPEGTRDHDYYEMIGKYEQFAPGWDDWSAWYDITYRGNSSNRNSYLQMRLEANRFLKSALTAGGLLFLNHALTSAEALIWGLRGERQRLPAAEASRSPWNAALKSLLLPGWGQRSQGKRTAANVFVMVEGLFWGGVIGLNKYSGWKLEDSRRWAALYAGSSLAGKDDDYFQYLALYPDMTTFNAAQYSGLGDPSSAYPAGAGYDWRWSSEREWKRYRELRRDSRLASSYATVALGGIVAGRLVGVATALISGNRSGFIKSDPVSSSATAPLITIFPGGIPGFRIIAAIR